MVCTFLQVHHELEEQTEEEKERQFYSSGGGSKTRGGADGSKGKSGRIDCSMSGTTATVILHVHAQKKLYIAHVGDSRAVLARRVSPKKKKKKSSNGEGGGGQGFDPEGAGSNLPSSSASTREPFAVCSSFVSSLEIFSRKRSCRSSTRQKQPERLQHGKSHTRSVLQPFLFLHQSSLGRSFLKST